METPHLVYYKSLDLIEHIDLPRLFTIREDCDPQDMFNHRGHAAVWVGRIETRHLGWHNRVASFESYGGNIRLEVCNLEEIMETEELNSIEEASDFFCTNSSAVEKYDLFSRYEWSSALESYQSCLATWLAPLLPQKAPTAPRF